MPKYFASVKNSYSLAPTTMQNFLKIAFNPSQIKPSIKNYTK